MNPWPAILILSALVGGASGRLIRGTGGVIVGGAAAWLGTAAWVLYMEFLSGQIPQPGRGPSMWPIALIVAGTVAAIVGAGSALFVHRLRRKSRTA